jgi:O-methyltransferase domain
VRRSQGDFFNTPIPETDVMMMGHILQDWNLEEKKLLIRRAYDAVRPGGALMVYESIIDDDRSKNALGLLMSLNMLIENPGWLRLHWRRLYGLDEGNRLQGNSRRTPRRSRFNGGGDTILRPRSGSSWPELLQNPSSAPAGLRFRTLESRLAYLKESFCRLLRQEVPDGRHRTHPTHWFVSGRLR